MSRWCIQLWTMYEMRLMTEAEKAALNQRRSLKGMNTKNLDNVHVQEGVTPHWECDMLTPEERYTYNAEGRICEAGMDFDSILRLAAWRSTNYPNDQWRIFDHDTGEEIPLDIMVKA